MLKRLFGKGGPDPVSVTVTLNARLQPMDRGERFEDPLAEAVGARAEVTGGGTLLAETGEIEVCDIEIELREPGEALERLIITTLEGLGAPKGSVLRVASPEREVPFGRTEGLAVYLNGTDLPDETYANCDSNFVYDEMNRLLAPDGSVYSHWQGPRETALYAYGRSFDDMKQRLQPLLTTYPLCAQCRVVQVA
jgi:hypothetical protein